MCVLACVRVSVCVKEYVCVCEREKAKERESVCVHGYRGWDRQGNVLYEGDCV